MRINLAISSLNKSNPKFHQFACPLSRVTFLSNKLARTNYRIALETPIRVSASVVEKRKGGKKKREKRRKRARNLQVNRTERRGETLTWTR